MNISVPDLLKYANLQMAAEGLFGVSSSAQPGTRTGPAPIQTAWLTNGNTRASRFTMPVATEFANEWTLVDHQSNTSTGFSGTLLKNLQSGELVISIRSTEFLDDYARDTKEADDLEVGITGWAFGQLADLEKWYGTLRAKGDIPASGRLVVTGYSLGGHLATAFTMLHSDRVTSTYTFNGAGVGKIKPGYSLAGALAEFTSRRAFGSNVDLFTDEQIRDIYQDLGGQFMAGSLNTPSDIAARRVEISGRLTLLQPSSPTYKQLKLLEDALARMSAVAKDADYASTVKSGDGKVDPPRNVLTSAIEPTSLDYQLAVLQAARQTESFDAIDALLKAKGTRSRTTENRANVVDVYADSANSLVANSQAHLGQSTRVWIEDQPDQRGNVKWATVEASFKTMGARALVDGFSKNDFGDTHSLVLLVDSLSVQDVFAQLDPGLDASRIKQLFDAASNARVESGTITSVGVDNQGFADGDSLENLVNGLGTLLASDSGNNWVRLKGDRRGNTWARPGSDGDFTGREALATNIAILREDEDFRALEGKVSITSVTGSLADAAKLDFGALAALEALTPFRVSAKDASGQSKLNALWTGAWSDQYSGWQSDRLAWQAGREGSAYSNMWLSDRGTLLAGLVSRNSRNLGFITGTANAEYIDAYSEQTLRVTAAAGASGVTQPVGRIIFGDGSSAAISGESGTDHLYGGAGNDTLSGLAGHDYLEGNADDDLLDGGANDDTLVGGRGNDTYVFAGAWGKDVIRDADGLGSIQIDGQTIGATQGAARDVWTATLGNGQRIGLAIARDARSSTGARLVIARGGSTENIIIIENFDEERAKNDGGYLGIKLDGSINPELKKSGTQTTALNGASGFSVTLKQALKAGEQLKLSVAGTVKGWIKAVLGDDIVDADGAILPVAPGQTQVSFALVREGTSNEETGGTISVSVQGGDRAETSNGYAVTLAATPQSLNRITGDNPQAETFKDKLAGTAGADLVQGLGDTDLLLGFGGDDSIEGGPGWDILMGGLGADTLVGGDGSDILYGSASGSMPPAPVSPPAGHTVLAEGDGWQITGDGRTYAEGVPVFYFDTEINRESLPQDAGNTLDAGDGDDHIFAGTGDDYVKGGDGKDFIFGMAGADVIRGDAGDDLVYGDGNSGTSLDSPGADFLDGGEGNDVLYGQGGADAVYGGDGSDRMWGDDRNLVNTPVASHGADYLDGEGGDDLLAGGGLDDTLYGGDGADAIWGDLGADFVGTLDPADPASRGNDYADGEDGNDTLVGQGGLDTLYGGSGSDLLKGDDDPARVAGESHGEDYLDGEDGNDTLVGGGDDDTLYGSAGDDSVMGDAVELQGQWHGDDYLDGEDGNDTLYGQGGDDSIYGGAGADKLLGDEGNLDGAFHGDDYIDGEAGNDTIAGGGGDDTLYAGDGDDAVWGDENDPLGPSFHGSDYLDGEAGNDTLLGQGADDTLFGGAGDDQLQGDAQTLGGAFHGADALDGGDGDDTLVGGGRDDTLIGGAGTDVLLGDQQDLAAEFHGNDVLAGGDGDDFLLGQGGHDTLDGGDGNDQLEGDDATLEVDAQGADSLDGGAGDDSLWGYAGNDTLLGGSGNDYLSGGPGNDYLDGGEGDDTLEGGDGDDTLEGGEGTNHYHLKPTAARTTVIATARDVVSLGAGVKLDDVVGGSFGDGELSVELRGGRTVTVKGTADHFRLDDEPYWGWELVDHILFPPDTAPSGGAATGSPATNLPGTGIGTPANRTAADRYDAEGRLIGQTWYAPDGSHGTQVVDPSGLVEASSLSADGRSVSVERYGVGQTLTRYFDAQGQLTGSTVEHVHGLNTITVVLDGYGRKLRESSVQSDGRLLQDLPGTQDYNGLPNLAFHLGANLEAGSWRTSETGGYLYNSGAGGSYGTSWWTSAAWGESNFRTRDDGTVFEARSSMNWRDAYDRVGIELWMTEATSPLTEAYFDGPDRITAYALYDVFDYNFTGLTLWSALAPDGTKYIVAEGSDGYSPRTTVATGTPVTLTYAGDFGNYLVLVDDGLGNVEVAGYTPDAVLHEVMWFHNDGSHGIDLYDGDGLRSRTTANGATIFTSTSDGSTATVYPGGTLLPAPLSEQPAARVDRPGAPSDREHPPSGLGDGLAYSYSISDRNGGRINIINNWWIGEIKIYRVDASGNMVSGVIDTDPGYSTEADTGSAVHHWDYDLTGRPTRRTTTDSAGRTESWTFDATGRPAQRSVSMHPDDGSVQTRLYDLAGRRVGSRVESHPQTGRTETRTYDAEGALTELVVDITDDLGNAITSTYGGDGSLHAVSQRQTTGTGATQISRFDGDGAVREIVLTSTSEDRVVTTSTYDGSGNLVTTVRARQQADGSFETSNFAADGTLTSFVVMSTEDGGDVHVTRRDSVGRVSEDAVLHADGTHERSQFSDDGAITRTTTQVDGRYSVLRTELSGSWLLTQYNAAGKALRDTWQEADGTSGSHVYGADAVTAESASPDGARSVSVSDPQGRHTVAEQFDASGVLSGRVETTRAHPRIIQVRFDASGAEIGRDVTLVPNHVPEAARGVASKSAHDDAEWRFEVPPGIFVDADDGDVLSVEASLADGAALPGWLAFDAITHTFLGRPPASSETQALGLRLTATDAVGASVSTSFTLAISHVNHAPVVGAALADATTMEDAQFSYALPAGTFADSDPMDVLVYSASLADGKPLPAWLTFDATSRSFAGTVGRVAGGRLELRVTATDPVGATATTTFSLGVTAVNHAPTAFLPIANATVLAGTPLSYSFNEDSFADRDAGDTLRYVATRTDGTRLPSWLQFDADTRSFAGLPRRADAGTLRIRVSAFDAEGLSTSQQFKIQVKASPERTGTSGDDLLVGTRGDDVMDGAAGADTMRGAAGDDLYFVDDVRDVVAERPGAGLDTVRTNANDYVLARDAEILELLGSADLVATGNAADNLLQGNGGANRLYGKAGNDTLAGGAGADLLSGGAGSDTYRLERGDGADTITEPTSLAEDLDVAQFGPGIAAEQLWFRRNGAHLQVAAIGTDDALTIRQWFRDPASHIEQFKTSDGKTLLDSQVQSLVDAMAAFNPPPAGQTSLVPEVQRALAPVFAASWH